MSDSSTPAGWYPAPHANNELRFWDGTQWLSWTPEQAAESQRIPAPPAHATGDDPGIAGATGDDVTRSPQTPPQGGVQTPHPQGPPSPESEPGAATGSNTVAVLALCLGIGALVVCWVPWVGLILAVVAVALGFLALMRKQRRSFALTGLILGAVALVVALLVTISFSAFLSTSQAESASRTVPEVTTTPPNPEPESSDGVASPAPAVEAEPEPEPEEPATPDLASFGTVDARTFALIAKEPDAHAGTNLIVFGDITQLDSATGPCTMLLSASESQKENSFDYEQNTLATSGDGESDCPVLDPLVEGDHVKMWVTVLGSFSYDTQIGGNTTVPALEVWQAELLPAQEY